MIELSARLRATRKTLLREIVDAAPPGSINLGLGQPVVAPPEGLAEAAAAACRAPALYTPNAGLEALRAAIGAAHGRSADEVLVTVGAQEALFLGLAGVVEAGDEVLVPDPGFPVYASIARWCGARPVPYALTAAAGFQLDPGAALAGLSGRARLMVLNTPGNPTGVCQARRRLEALLAGLAARGVAYLSDEVYGGLVHGAVDAALPGALAPEGGLVVGSLSKSHALMGWRLGWLLGPAETLRGLVPLHQMVATCAPTPLQRAALAAFTDEGARAAQALRDAMGARRQLALEALGRVPGLARPVSDGAIYLFVDVGRWGDDVALARALLDEKVIVIPGQAFGPGGRGHIRVAFGVEPDALVEGLARLTRGLARLDPGADTTPDAGEESR